MSEKLHIGDSGETVDALGRICTKNGTPLRDRRSRSTTKAFHGDNGKPNPRSSALEVRRNWFKSNITGGHSKGNAKHQFHEPGSFKWA